MRNPVHPVRPRAGLFIFKETITMADYFTHFSCNLVLNDAGQIDKALALFKDCETRLEEEESVSIGFSIEGCAESSPHLWIWSDDYGDPNQVIAFVSALGPMLGLTGLWGFEWANTCSRPRIDAFGGGAAVIDLATGDIIDMLSTNSWMTRMVQDPLNVED